MLSMLLNNRGTSGPAGEQTGTAIFSKINRVHEKLLDEQPEIPVDLYFQEYQ